MIFLSKSFWQYIVCIIISVSINYYEYVIHPPMDKENNSLSSEDIPVISKFAGQTAGSYTVGGWGNKKVLTLVLTLLLDLLLFALWPTFHNRHIHTCTHTHPHIHYMILHACQGEIQWVMKDENSIGFPV